MRRIAVVFAVEFFAAVSLTAGCGGHGGSTMSPTGASLIENAYQTLEARERVHHQVALTSTDVIDLRAETARYAAEMDSLMMDICRALGDSGMMEMMGMCDEMGDSMMIGMMDMMGGREMDTMHTRMSRISDSVHIHHARMDSIPSIESMRDECAEHHATMVRMIDEMRDGMRAGEDNGVPDGNDDDLMGGGNGHGGHH